MLGLSAHDTRLGALQRGLGRGHLQALADGADAAPDVVACVLHDPRVSIHDSRARYYAELVTALGLDITPIANAAREAATLDETLAQDVLGELYGRGHEATRAAADNDPGLGISVALYLRNWQQWAADHLPAAIVSQLADHLEDHDLLVEDVETYGEFWHRYRSRFETVQTAMVDAAALAAAEAAKAPTLLDHPSTMSTADVLVEAANLGWQRIGDELLRRNEEKDLALLAACVARDDSPQRIRMAARALAEHGDLRLLDLCEQIFDRPEDEIRSRSVEFSRRASLASYFTDLGAAPTLPLARRWWQRGGFFRTASARVLSTNATPEDTDWIAAYVSSQLHRCDGTELAFMVQALASTGDVAATPTLADAFERLPYGYARIRAVAGLAQHPESPAATDIWPAAMWDSEEDVRRLGCLHADRDQGRLDARRATLRDDPLEDEDVRKAAAEALGAAD
jgi:hypothetical protein